MRLLLALMVLAATVSIAPAASAHACSGVQSDCVCPVPSDGKAHSHAGPSGSCTNGAAATPGGASVPGLAAPLVLISVALAMFAFRK